MTTIGAALVGGAWLWGKFSDKVTERAGTLLGDTGRQLWKKIDWQNAAERYRGEMQRLYGTMRIIGMAEPVALADIFTDVYLLDRPSAWLRYNIEELQRQEQIEEVESPQSHRDDALKLIKRHERLMILGKPGAGKTTLLKHLVLQCTTGKLDAVPIFVGLKSWADSGLELMAFLAQQFLICAFPDAQRFIETILSEGHALVLFDGLDEVNLEQGVRERITREIRDLANQYPRSKCVITCRTAANDYQFEYFVYCELADFTEDQMRTFVANWFLRDKAKHIAFLAEFAKPEHERLRDLGRTPLLLTLLCLTFDETMTFPERRAEIYEEALDALLKKWDASRSIKRDTVYRQLSLGHKRQMLARIAAETFAKNKLFIRQADLVEHIVTYLAKLPQSNLTEEIDGEAILRSIEGQHGLLVERAHRIYSFSHLTFQEYFTARFTVEHPSRQMFDSIVTHAYDARWREVLLLIASMLDDANAESFFDAFEAAVHALVQGEPTLTPLIQWIQRKLEGGSPTEQADARMLYMVLALIMIAGSSHLAGQGALDLYRALDFAKDLSVVRTRASALDGAVTRARTLSGAAARARDLALDLLQSQMSDASHPIMIAFQTDCVWTGILLWVQAMAGTEPYNPVRTDHDRLIKIFHQHASRASSELRAALTQLIWPERDAPAKDWQQFAADLRAVLVTHQDIGHAWMLNGAQVGRLANYLEGSTRMLECVDLAAVADRDGIRNRLLLPPQP